MTERERERGREGERDTLTTHLKYPRASAGETLIIAIMMADTGSMPRPSSSQVSFRLLLTCQTVSGARVTAGPVRVGFGGSA